MEDIKGFIAFFAECFTFWECFIAFVVTFLFFKKFEKLPLKALCETTLVRNIAAGVCFASLGEMLIKICNRLFIYYNEIVNIKDALIYNISCTFLVSLCIIVFSIGFIALAKGLKQSLHSNKQG